MENSQKFIKLLPKKNTDMKHIETFEQFIAESKNNSYQLFDNFGDAALSEYLNEIIMLAAEYTDEDLESLSGQVPRSADDAVKMVLDYIPAKDKKKFLSQVDKIKKP